jgi:hypothetical protein
VKVNPNSLKILSRAGSRSLSIQERNYSSANSSVYKHTHTPSLCKKSMDMVKDDPCRKSCDSTNERLYKFAKDFSEHKRRVSESVVNEEKA